jgi:cellulose synthase (UDP-forming)
MRILNIIYAVTPLFLSSIFTYLTYASIFTLWLAFGVWLSMIVGFFIFIDFYRLSRKSTNYEINYTTNTKKYKIASFVTSFNENPEIVEGTLISVKLATKDYGDVYLLDDSTDQKIAEELKAFCEKYGIIYLHRKDRKGFKAGAINEALRKVGDNYDLVAIFDADQRPTENFFEQVLPYFSDPKVALVQVPQNYSETYSGIAKASKYQQEPFLRIIMRGRTFSSAFSLGSGSVFRISALKEVGYMDESSITEDAATSIKLHEKGYTSVYVDSQLIWYGEPPEDINAYLTQQSRWAFGYFQLTWKILKSNLNFSQFVDYFSGSLYWVKEGPLAIVEFLAPVFFLLFKLPIIILNPLIYILAYIPYLLVSIAHYIYTIKGKGEYGIKGFYYHQSVEYLEFLSVTLAFFSWIIGKKRPFKVTPKGEGKFNVKSVIPHMIIIILLILSIIEGFLWLTKASSSSTLYYSIIINIFWAIYQIPFLIGGIILAKMMSRRENYVEVALNRD